MRLIGIVLSLSCFYLGACSDSPKGNNTRVYQFENEDTAKTAFKNSNIVCRANNCIESVGGLTTYTKTAKSYDVALCTSTLIGANLVLTNKHCIPDDLQRKDVSCKGRIMFKFPAVGGHPQESVDCGSIVDLADESTSDDEHAAHPDWAVVRMQESLTRKPIETDIHGIANLKSVTMYPVFYTFTKTSSTVFVLGDMRKTQCKTDYRSALGDYFFHKLAALFGVDACSENIIHGNSGSGLISEEGRLIGVGSFARKATDDSALPEMGGTNLACIKYFNKNPSVFCKFDGNSFSFRMSLMFIKLYAVLNEEGFYKISRHNYVETTNHFIKPGSGIKTLSYQKQPGVSGILYVDDIEVEDYHYANLAGFAFKDSGKCVEASAPASFASSIPVYSLSFPSAPLSEILTPIPVEQSSVQAQFIRSKDIYKVTITKQTIKPQVNRIIEKLVWDEFSCMLKTNFFTLKGGDMPIESCMQTTNAKSAVDSLSGEERSAAKTNLFLDRSDLEKIELEIPICN